MKPFTVFAKDMCDSIFSSFMLAIDLIMFRPQNFLDIVWKQTNTKGRSGYKGDKKNQCRNGKKKTNKNNKKPKTD